MEQHRRRDFAGLIDLTESQRWPLHKLEEFQNDRTKKIIAYAYEQIPGYRKKFDHAGVKPTDVRGKNDLWKLPVVTREELSENEEFLNTQLVSSTLLTGGTSGIGFKYYESGEATQVRWNAHLRGWSWNGYTPGKRLAVICSAQGTIEEENTLNLTGDLSIENLKKSVNKLLEFKPQHLRGYVSSLYILAKYSVDNGIRWEGIESIDPISENLYDFQRELMEEAFRCRVFEEYCCNDGGACGWECEAHEGLHHFMERAIIEEIDGQMIVTDLWNLAMPFVRYRNNDSVMFLNRKCSCGRELPLMKVHGRSNDIIISRNRMVSPTLLIFHTKSKVDGRRIHAIQYVQRPGYLIEVNIVKTVSCSERHIEELGKFLAEFFEGLTVRVNILDDIPSTKRGKRAFIINEDWELLERTFGKGVGARRE